MRLTYAWTSRILGLVGLAVLIFSIAVSITLGPVQISVPDVMHIVAFKLNESLHLSLIDAPKVNKIAMATVWELRLPRAVLAALSGAGLGLCGLVLQSILRNSMADPYLLGVSAGASTGAVLIIAFSALASTFVVSSGAFVGALVAFALVVFLARMAGGGNQKTILAGIAITQLFSALTSFLIMVAVDSQSTRGVLFWLLGSLSSSSWSAVALVGAVVCLGFVVVFTYNSALDGFAFGGDAAASLGINVKNVRIVLLGISALITAVIVANSGASGFVGLVLPHLCRMLVGFSHRYLIPITTLFGAILLVWVDTAGRTIAEPTEIPVGVLTALIGVPIFAFLLLKSGKVQS